MEAIDDSNSSNEIGVTTRALSNLDKRPNKRKYFVETHLETVYMRESELELSLLGLLSSFF